MSDHAVVIGCVTSTLCYLFIYVWSPHFDHCYRSGGQGNAFDRLPGRVTFVAWSLTVTVWFPLSVSTMAFLTFSCRSLQTGWWLTLFNVHQTVESIVITINDKYCSTYSMAPWWSEISVLWSTSSHSHCVFATTSITVIVKNSKIILIIFCFCLFMCVLQRAQNVLIVPFQLLRDFYVYVLFCLALFASLLDKRNVRTECHKKYYQ